MNHKTSWEKVSDWYDKLVSKEGHYYHQSVIFPNLLGLLREKKIKLLDLGCGAGPFSRQLPKGSEYWGYDISESLIKSAIAQNKHKEHRFAVADVTQPLQLEEHFTHAVMILSLQNMAKPEGALLNAAHALKERGKLILVLNHPCFRIPRQTSWGIDEARKLQFRRVDRYMSPLEIPIQHHATKDSPAATTFSYHHSLSSFAALLRQSGFVIIDIQEWCSDKSSEGKNAKMENRAREEFPLFLTFVCQKIMG
jgi:ubiquinone/menaquinone biosynthesis C-methylase UbiE